MTRATTKRRQSPGSSSSLSNLARRVWSRISAVTLTAAGRKPPSPARSAGRSYARLPIEAFMKFFEHQGTVPLQERWHRRSESSFWFAQMTARRRAIRTCSSVSPYSERQWHEVDEMDKPWNDEAATPQPRRMRCPAHPYVEVGSSEKCPSCERKTVLVRDTAVDTFPDPDDVVDSVERLLKGEEL